MTVHQYAVLFLILHIAALSEGNLTFKIAQQNFTLRDTLDPQVLSDKYMTRSRVECNVRCLEVNCSSYFYNIHTGQCQVNYEEIRASYATHETGWTCFTIPVDGGWENWGSCTPYNTCSKTCGTGVQNRSRTRTCTHPRPLYGGQPCFGSDTEIYTQDCNTQPCPVDGVWSTWGPWSGYSTCSTTCDSGIQTSYRERTCTNPIPQYGGLGCSGTDAMDVTRSCFLLYCPVDGGWSGWNQWSTFGPCSQSCDTGVESRSRDRTCTEPTPQHSGSYCTGSDTESDTQECNTQACPPTCPSDYIHDSSAVICFKYYTGGSTTSSYAKMNTKCAGDGGALVKVTSFAKQKAIEAELATRSPTQFVVIQGTLSSGVYKYDDGTTFVYDYWDSGSGQPSNEPYVSLMPSKNYKWHDITPQISYSDFICEIPM